MHVAFKQSSGKKGNKTDYHQTYSAYTELSTRAANSRAHTYMLSTSIAAVHYPAAQVWAASRRDKLSRVRGDTSAPAALSPSARCHFDRVHLVVGGPFVTNVRTPLEAAGCHALGLFQATSFSTGEENALKFGSAICGILVRAVQVQPRPSGAEPQV